MLRLSFIYPAALALLALLPLLWALAWLPPRRVSGPRRWLSLGLRTLLFTALVGALAGAQLTQPARNATTVFVLDASESVAAPQRARAQTYLETALRTLPAGDRAAIVVFGENALVERIPSEIAALGRLTSVPIASRTNLQDAIQLGMALLPGDTQRRLVLLSDGGENIGRAAEAARLAQVRNVPIDVVSLAGDRGPDVVVGALRAPATAREGQQVGMTLSVDSRLNAPSSGRLRVFADGQLVEERDVTLQPGANAIPISVDSGASGFRRIEAQLETQGDATGENNRAAAYTDVQGPPRILLIAADPARAANLRDALAAAGVRPEVRSPADAPVVLEQLSQYAGLILVDTPASAVPRQLLTAIPTYVQELGRGFAMIGGVDSFGAGGYRRAPRDDKGRNIEDVLPVALDPLDQQLRPDLGLMLVIDRSGSMSERGDSGSSRTKLDLAKEAVYQASLGLSPQDQLGLVAFESEAQTIIELQKLPTLFAIQEALSRFSADGGTNIRPGLKLAADALIPANTKIKHVILLTDGIADSNYSDLVDQLRQAGVTISTIALGTDANPNLEAVAKQGGGRFYRVTKPEEMPRIFLQETVIVAGRDVLEGRFEPAVGVPSPAVRGLGTLPPLYGRNGVEIKPDARQLIVTPDGKPVLAQWQYGLGRSVAWTSDMQGKWGTEWVRWAEFPRFVSAIADILLPPRVAEQVTLQATGSGATAAFEASAQDAQGRPLNGLNLTGRLVDPSGKSAPVTFTQVAPGRYRATAPAAASGVYLAEVAAQDGQGQQLGRASAGLVVSYSPEYGETRENPALLRELAALTAGRVDPAAEQVFAAQNSAVGAVREIGLPLLWLALLLLPLDIAVRRLTLRRGDGRALLDALRRRRPAVSAAPTATVTRLSAARDRAGVRAGTTTDDRPATTDRRPQTAAEIRPPTTATADQQRAKPAPSAATERKQPEAEEPAAPSAAPGEEETMARLLAAKKRARK